MKRNWELRLTSLARNSDFSELKYTESVGKFNFANAFLFKPVFLLLLINFLVIMKKVLPSYFKRNQFYFYTALGFLVWLTFFDRSNLISQFNLWMDLNKLEEQKGYYEEQLRLVKIEEKEIMGNAKSLEKFAREKYLMKKEGETVFVLVDKDGNLIEEKE